MSVLTVVSPTTAIVFALQRDLDDGAAADAPARGRDFVAVARTRRRIDIRAKRAADCRPSQTGAGHHVSELVECRGGERLIAAGGHGNRRQRDDKTGKRRIDRHRDYAAVNGKAGRVGDRRLELVGAGHAERGGSIVRRVRVVDAEGRIARAIRLGDHAPTVDQIAGVIGALDSKVCRGSGHGCGRGRRAGFDRRCARYNQSAGQRAVCVF